MIWGGGGKNIHENVIRESSCEFQDNMSVSYDLLQNRLKENYAFTKIYYKEMYEARLIMFKIYECLQQLKQFTPGQSDYRMTLSESCVQ